MIVDAATAKRFRYSVSLQEVALAAFVRSAVLNGNLHRVLHTSPEHGVHDFIRLGMGIKASFADLSANHVIVSLLHAT